MGPDPCATDAGAGPTQLVCAPACGSINFTVANGAVFWTEKATGNVKSVPTAGGRATVLATAQAAPGPIAVEGSSVFWVVGGEKTIMKKDLSGGMPKVFVAATTVTEVLGGENDIGALLVDQGSLYFGRYTLALRVPTTGGTMPKVIGRSPETDLGKPAAFAIDDAHLYQTESDHSAVTREALDGTQNGLLEDGVTRQPLAPDRIAISQGDLLLDAIAVDNGIVIWANGNNLRGKPVGAGEHEFFLPLATTSAETLVTGFVVSDDTVYLGWSPRNQAGVRDEGAIMKVPLQAPVPVGEDGGVPEATTIATEQLGPGQLAADATHIYWRTADCKIMKLAKAAAGFTP